MDGQGGLDFYDQRVHTPVPLGGPVAAVGNNLLYLSPKQTFLGTFHICPGGGRCTWVSIGHCQPVFALNRSYMYIYTGHYQHSHRFIVEQQHIYNKQSMERLHFCANIKLICMIYLVH